MMMELTGAELETFTLDQIGTSAATAAADAVMRSEGDAAGRALTFQHEPHAYLPSGFESSNHLLPGYLCWLQTARYG